MITLGTILPLILSLTGCGTKTIIVPAGSPVRLREETTAEVWVRDNTGTWVQSRTRLPAGWYAGPPSAPKVNESASKVQDAKESGDTSAVPLLKSEVIYR